ncbi:MAG TPA: hypothetical protein VFH45_01810, partial [Acidimicrobiales bacterium]|nr:hypothetical protein [Acidimicrobiales bacterium]
MVLPVMVAAPFVLLAVRVVAQRRHVYLQGDFALIDLQARRALHWAQDTGVYDRFGWRHPGPAWPYAVSLWS